MSVTMQFLSATVNFGENYKKKKKQPCKISIPIGPIGGGNSLEAYIVSCSNPPFGLQNTS